MVDIDFVLSAADVADIMYAKGVGFGVKLSLQNPQHTLSFARADEIVFTASDVLITWANREAEGEGAPALDVIGTEGQLQRWQTLPLQTGDQFAIDGHVAEIVSPVIVDDGVARAGFRIVSGG